MRKRKTEERQQRGRDLLDRAENGESVFECLTPREKEVVALMARGYTNRQIAQGLYISEHTVKNHVSNIYKKLAIDDRTQIALLAIKKGLARLD